MSKFEPFVMERMMSKFENVVEFNLSESGVHPMTLGELLDMGGALGRRFARYGNRLSTGERGDPAARDYRSSI